MKVFTILSEADLTTVTTVVAAAATVTIMAATATEAVMVRHWGHLMLLGPCFGQLPFCSCGLAFWNCSAKKSV